MAVIPDVPEEIEIQEKRQEFIVGKVIDQIADDIDEDVPIQDAVFQFETYKAGGGFFRDKNGAHATNPLLKNIM
jgi:hypothetical protein